MPNVQFFSLQKGPAAQQLTAGECTAHVVDHTGELRDFADTAASSRTWIWYFRRYIHPHLAGALNRPVWILNRFDTCWRWMLERNDTPWYPRARLFRQPSLGDWDSVMETVRAALADHALAWTGVD